MGTYSEMILEGLMCQCCGVFVGSSPGHPRYCKSCAKELNIKEYCLIAQDEI